MVRSPYSSTDAPFADFWAEDGFWDTSKALVRRTLIKCIETGRKYRGSNNKNKPDQYEAFRLLGQALHTLEGQ